MKRILSVLLALALTASTATVAFAKKGDDGVPSGKAEFGYLEVDPGDTIELDTDWFYGSWKETEKQWDAEKQRDVNVTITHEEPVGRLYKEYHTVSASWRSGSQYVQGVYFDEGDSYVTVEIKGGIASTVDREVSGTIKIVEKNIPNRDKTVTYECDIEKGTLIIKGIDEKSRMTETGDREFGLPYDYQTKQVRFSTEDGESYGTFIGDFRSDKSGEQIAEFQVRVIDQSALYLGFSESANKTVANKYPDADLRFINWTARPTFAREGKLSLFMDPDEYIYGINDDNTLYRLGGTYNEATDAYVITTATLGSYVISDTQLSASGSGSSGGTTSTTSPSSTTAPSSTAPSSTAPSSTAPPPSSTAPQPSSSVAPPPSSSEDPAEEDPEEEDPYEDPEDEDPYDDDDYDPDDDDDDDDEDEEKTQKKKFPLVPVLFGVLGVVILICAVVVVGNRNSGSRSRSRRRRYDDDWDD